MFTPMIAAALLHAAQAVAIDTPPLPRIPPASIDEGLEVTGDALAARQFKSRMYVSVNVNGKGPYRFFVDSGADRSVIGADLARALDLPPGSPVLMQSVTGSSRVETVMIETLKVGASEIEAIQAPALPERYLGADGLLGIDALSDQRLMLDFDKKTVTVQDSRRPVEPTIPGEIVVTARRRNGQLILTQASVGKQRVYAVLDTGSEVTVGNSALAAKIFSGKKAPAAVRIDLIGVTGQSVSANASTLPRVQLGGVTLTNVPVAFADLPPFKLFGLEHQPALLLGSDTLSAFRRVALDFRNRKVRFVIR